MELTQDRVALINSLLDFIFLNVHKQVTTLKDYRAVPIHDLVKKLRVDLALATLPASLAASKGTLSDLTTIRRVGDASLTSTDNTIFISVTVSLDFLELFFRKYILKVGIIKLSGDKLRLTIKKNLFDLFLVLQFNELECEMCFERFKLTHFSDIDVDITGFGFLNPVARRVADWVVRYFNNYVVREVAEPYAKNLFNSAISDKDMLQRMLGHAIYGMVKGVVKNTNQPDPPIPSSSGTQETASESRPVAPLRQRRLNRSLIPERQDPKPSQQNNARPAISQANNFSSQSSLASSHSNGSVTQKTQEVTVRNNLKGRKNEILIQPKSSLFSSKPCKLVDAAPILPMKPAIL